MKELVSNIRFYLRVLAKKIQFAWQIETAYAGNTIGELFSTVFYNITFIIFIDIVLRKYKLLAGYSFNDMLILVFVTQIVFYTGLTITYDSMSKFVQSVRDGIFDTYLLKPMSVFFQVMTLSIRPFSGLFFSVPPLLIYVLLIIKNQAFHPEPFGVTIGLLGIFVGILYLHFYRFTFAMFVFKTKQVKNLLKTLDLLGDAGSFPYEAYTEPFRTIVFFIAPFLAAAAIPATYFLNKTTSLWPFVIQIGLMLFFMTTALLLWRKGLKEYESVSS